MPQVLPGKRGECHSAIRRYALTWLRQRALPVQLLAGLGQYSLPEQPCVVKLYLNFCHNRHLGMVKRDTAAQPGPRVGNLLKDFIRSFRSSEPEIRYQESKRLL